MVDGTRRFSLHNQNLLYPALAFSVAAGIALLACSPSPSVTPTPTETSVPAATATLAQTPVVSSSLRNQESITFADQVTSSLIDKFPYRTCPADTDCYRTQGNFSDDPACQVYLDIYHQDTSRLFAEPKTYGDLTLLTGELPQFWCLLNGEEAKDLPPQTHEQLLRITNKVAIDIVRQDWQPQGQKPNFQPVPSLDPELKPSETGCPNIVGCNRTRFDGLGDNYSFVPDDDGEQNSLLMQIEENRISSRFLVFSYAGITPMKEKQGKDFGIQNHQLVIFNPDENISAYYITLTPTKEGKILVSTTVNGQQEQKTFILKPGENVRLIQKYLSGAILFHWDKDKNGGQWSTAYVKRPADPQPVRELQAAPTTTTLKLEGILPWNSNWNVDSSTVAATDFIPEISLSGINESNIHISYNEELNRASQGNLLSGRSFDMFSARTIDKLKPILFNKHNQLSNPAFLEEHDIELFRNPPSPFGAGWLTLTIEPNDVIEKQGQKVRSCLVSFHDTDLSGNNPQYSDNRVLLRTYCPASFYDKNPDNPKDLTELQQFIKNILDY